MLARASATDARREDRLRLLISVAVAEISWDEVVADTRQQIFHNNDDDEVHSRNEFRKDIPIGIIHTAYN